VKADNNIVKVSAVGIGIKTNPGVAARMFIGIGIKTNPGVAARMFKALSEENINIEMISTSEYRISCVIEEKYGELGVRTVHHAFGLDNTEHTETS